VSPNPIRRRIQESLFEQAPMSIAVVDPGLRIVEANGLFESTYGPWKGRKCYEVYKKRDEPCPDCPALKTFKDGRTRASTEQGEDKGGCRNWYRVRFFPIKEGEGIPYVVEMATDVTDLVSIEQEYDFLFDNVPCYVTVLDRDFRIVKANRFFKEKFGRDGKSFCYEMYKGSESPCADCPAIRVFETGELHSSLQVGVDKDGKSSRYMVTAAPLRTAGKRVTSIIEMALDLSELTELKDRLRRAEAEKLESERLAAVGQTVAGLSHGIKNIIMGLEGGMYVVNSGLRRDDKKLVKRGWEMLENNISRISAFTAEFLSFAKGTEPRIGEVDPVAVAKEVEALYSETARRAGVVLRGSYPGTVAPALMDGDGLHTALANLVSNAIDACLMSDKEDLRVDLSCFEKDGSIFFTVRDSGCGMDCEVKKKLFTNFFTTKASGQGTGLGLLVTRKIMSQHGGRVEVNSSEGEGAEFVLEFPRERLPRVKSGGNKL